MNIQRQRIAGFSEVSTAQLMEATTRIMFFLAISAIVLITHQLTPKNLQQQQKINLKTLTGRRTKRGGMRNNSYTSKHNCAGTEHKPQQHQPH
jgi:hypothetical protein